MPPLRILISRPDRIGDVVLSTPLPREIKRRFPDSFIGLLLKEYTHQIYLNNPFVDEIIIADNRVTFQSELNMIKKLRRYKFNVALMLLPSKRTNRILTFTGLRKRIGVGHKFFQFIVNTKNVYRNKFIPLRHESDYCLDFLRKIDIQAVDISSEIYLSELEIDEVKDIKTELSEGKILIGINTTSGNSAPNWNISDYCKLIEMLLGRKEIKPVITDYNPPPELNYLELSFPNKEKQLRKSILNFAALDMLVSSSTGPMHICAGLKVSTISLFCPLTACSPNLWGPRGNKNVIILPADDYCRKNCPGDPKLCTLSGEGGISPEKVYMEIIKFLDIRE